MGISRSPLRVAFWAISAALLLMLLATLSDPYQVRQSLLARGGPGPTTGAETAPVAPRDRKPVSHRPSQTPHLPSEDAPASAAAALVTDTAAAGTPTAELPPEATRIAGGARAHMVSSGPAAGSRHVSRSPGRPAMPILAPGDLTGATAGGRFEELPPPPEWSSHQVASRNRSLGDEQTLLDASDNPALERLQLETELLTLRRDLAWSNQSRQIEEIQQLQQQHRALLERQQQTALRLEELAGRLDAQSTRLERLFDRHANTPAGSPTGEVTSGTMAELTGKPHPDAGAGGRQRLSLVIESDDVAGILERLGRWSPQTDSPPSSAALAQQIDEGGPSRYLAPPPGHADPTPLSGRDRLPVVTGQAEANGGPQFVAPSLCR